MNFMMYVMLRLDIHTTIYQMMKLKKLKPNFCVIQYL